MSASSSRDARRKALIIDTSVLIHDPNCIERFGDNLIVIPIWAVEELDNLKKHRDQVGESSRQISRVLDEYRSSGSLKDGVPTKSGGVIIIDYNGNDFSNLPQGLERNRDNRILSVAVAWNNAKPQRPKQVKGKRRPNDPFDFTFSEVNIITKDVNLRLKADACGVIAQDYWNDKHIPSVDFLYTGIATYQLSGNLSHLFDGASAIWRNFTIPEHHFQDELNLDKILRNQCCFMEIDGKTIYTIYKKEQGIFKIIKIAKDRSRRISPINIEQALLLDMALDPEINLVTATGHAGTGKTLMALLAGYNQLGSEFDQLLVYRPNVPLGQDLGFLPGDINEKFAPWMQPIFDNMYLIVGKKEEANNGSDSNGNGKGTFNPVKELIAGGQLDISPINYIRGRSINHCFIIIDEAQNLTPHEAKTIITRAGNGTKIILTGDVMQIDNPHVDSISNGLTHTIETMKDLEIYGHVTLKKSERSPLAELAATRM